MPRRGDGFSFLFRHVLHDWPDDKVIEILANVARAAGPESRILLVESITPIPASDAEPNDHPVTLDNLVHTSRYQALTAPTHIPHDFGAASRSKHLLSLYLLSVMNAQERTLAQWKRLIEAADMRVSGVFALRSMVSVIECRAANAGGEALLV
ncbi:O-methyltransferase 7 [Grifola frondosa]|uniref:O-methyltransferase 7 n=1 Tax=Grifola frondosa TaxID=5627 RepID=A0A1C7LUP5_GRIFR|nr:O-methyltransferase 7 [Grifola frondosa]